MPSYTKKAIQESFLKLLDQRPLDQITVKDIVEDCGVNRNSFYYHFADIPTMVTDLIIERSDAIIAQYGTAGTLEECLKAAVEFATEHRRAILHLYRSSNRAMVEEYLMRICRHAVEHYAQVTVGEVPIQPEDREILIRFFQCECFGQVVAWLDDGMRYDVERQFSRLCQLMSGMTEGLVRRCAQDAPAEASN